MRRNLWRRGVLCGLAGLLVMAAALPAARGQTGVGATHGPAGVGRSSVMVVVRDENGVSVPSAQVTLTRAGTSQTGETDYAGEWRVYGASPGEYAVSVIKEGFFAVTGKKVNIGASERLEVTLNHQHEYVQSVNVVYSPPALNPKQTVSTERLSNADIINLPYPVTRDIRYVLPFLPGVLQDGSGQLHVEGSDTRQIEDRLDGFNATGPASGQFNLRVSIDAIRSATVESTRIPAQYNDGSGGLLSLATGMGDNRLRWSATDFLPQLQSRGGLHLNHWYPRATLSGPIQKDKAWFLFAPEFEYSNNVYPDLPPGGNQASDWRFGGLVKTQINLTPRNILTGTYLANRLGSRHDGLSLFDPVESTTNLSNQADFFAVKDQAYLGNDALVEAGLAVTRFHASELPQGSATYILLPDGTRGNYYESSATHSKRIEGIANAFLPPVVWLGRHDFKVGLDFERVTFDDETTRRPYQILREDGTLARSVSFTTKPFFARDDFAAGAYAEDQWSASERLTVAGGARLDWDEVTRRAFLSPRVAASYMLSRDRETKIVAGVGEYSDVSNLEFLTRPLDAARFDTFYDAAGTAPLGLPAETSFAIAPGSARASRALNWSAGIEQRLPASIYLKAQILERRGHDGWAYVNSSPTAAIQPGGVYQFTTTRRDRYDAVKVSARKAFGRGYSFFASYERSRAHTNQALDFSVDNPVFGPQTAGPLPWDSPNRFLSWGWLPLVRGFNLGYSMDVHTGFPFFLVNDEQQLVAPPGARRFPTYFTLNMTVEKRIHFFGFEWAVRGGFDDITNRHNATAVDNNVNSPHFLELSGLTGRAFVARLRLLGRK